MNNLRALACPVCLDSEKDKKNKFILDEYIIKICQNCGSLFNSIFEQHLEREAFFNYQYFREVQNPAFKHVDDDKSQNSSTDIYLKLLEDLKSMDNKNETLLDVGAAFGDFVLLAKENNWNSSGVEISPYAAEFARNKRDLNVKSGDIFQITENSNFDVITYWDVIEHVDRVSDNLTHANKLLNEHKFLLIATDRYDSLLGYLCKFLYTSSFGRFKYPIKKYFIKYNSWYPTSRSMRRLLYKSGFEVIKFQPIDYPIDKIKLKKWERNLLQILYFLGRVLRSQTQMLLICKKVSNV